ncbi:MAG TPA: GAF domain-containing protein [Verrucomicrobiae bacterium]|nr:GAF domain-containing protein [Verrucomicrobiae bacterium]
MISRSDKNLAQTRDARLALFMPPIMSLLAVAFLLVAGYTSWRGSSVLMERLAAGNAFLFLLMRLVIGQFQWFKRNPHGSATAAVALIASYAITGILVSSALWSTMYIAFAILFTGFLFTSRVWFAGVAVMICACWGLATHSYERADEWSAFAGSLGASIFAATCLLELRRKAAHIESKTTPAPAAPKIDPALGVNPVEQVAPWCPVCRMSADAIVRHNGETVFDANSSAIALLGVSAFELPNLQVASLFAPDKQESLKPIFRSGKFQPFEIFAIGPDDQRIPVKASCGAPTGPEATALRTLILRDLRETEKLRQLVTAANRKSQQAYCRARDLAQVSRGQSRQTLEDKLKAIVNTTHQWLPCSVGCFVVMWDNALEQFSVAASSAANPLHTESLLAADGPSVIGWLSENGDPLIVHTVAEDEFGIRQLYPSEPVNAYCAFPLLTEEGIMGFLLVLERKHREFAADELDYLTIVAQLVTNACERAMYEEQLNLTESHANSH